MTPSELAKWIERSTDDVQDLLVGRAEITADVARRLASVLGASEAFGAARIAIPRGSRRPAAGGGAAGKRWMVERDPCEGHRALGMARGACRHTVAAAAACLQFFGVPSVGAWREVYGDAWSGC